MGRGRRTLAGVERVYVEHASRLRAVGARAGLQDADDIVQEATANCLKAERNSNILDPARFLLRSVKNTAISHIRDINKRRTRQLDEGYEFIDEKVNAEQALIAAERLRRVLTIIDTMPPRRREAFLLHRLEDLSYPQIARRMGVSIKAVEKHMALAMVQLHRELAADEEG